MDHSFYCSETKEFSHEHIEIHGLSMTVKSEFYNPLILHICLRCKGTDHHHIGTRIITIDSRLDESQIEEPEEEKQDPISAIIKDTFETASDIFLGIIISLFLANLIYIVPMILVGVIAFIIGLTVILGLENQTDTGAKAVVYWVGWPLLLIGIVDLLFQIANSALASFFMMLAAIFMYLNENGLLVVEEETGSE